MSVQNTYHSLEPQGSITKLVERLKKLSCDELAQTIIVVPTQRLATIIATSLAIEFESLRSPKFFTIESFISKIHSQALLSQNIIIDEIMAETLLRELILDKNYQNIWQGHEHEAWQLYQDMQETPPASFSAIDTFFTEDVFRSTKHAQIVLQRCQEIQHLFAAFTKRLQQLSLTTLQQRRQQNIKILCETNNWQCWPLLVFFGFTTVKSSYHVLLEQLSQRQDVEFWLPPIPVIDNECNPLAELVKVVTTSNSKNNKVTNNIKLGSHNTNNDILRQYDRSYAFSDPVTEVKWAIKEVRRYIDAGHNPANIMLLVANEKLYAPLLKQELSPIKHNISLPSSLISSLQGSFLQLLVNWLVTPTPLHQLVWLTHPITKQALVTKYSYDTYNCLVKELTKLLATDAERNIKKDIMSPILGQDFKSWFATILAHKSHRLSAKKWTQLLLSIVNCFPLTANMVKAHELHSNRVQQSIVTGLSAIEMCITRELFLNEYSEMVLNPVLHKSISTVGYPLMGVQVMRIIEARCIPTVLTIVLGATAGQFPRSHPKDNLLDDWLKTKMGLPGWQYVEALEETTFCMLQHYSKSLVLTYPHNICGQETSPSRFIMKMQSKLEHL